MEMTTMETRKSLYKKTAQRLENLRPVQKYIVYTLIFLAIGLVFGLVETYFRGPNNVPIRWWDRLFLWTYLGVASAFWSEWRRKHPFAMPEVTKYTRT
jgi:hypothetical protein